MVRIGLALTILLLKVSAAAAETVPGPDWDPNRDRAFIAQYVRREMSLDLEQVDPRRGVKGTVRNDGAKTLTRVRATVTFLDRDGKFSGDYEFSALPWSGPSTPGEPTERPLGPGGSREFLIYPSSVPQGWSDRWEAAITSVTFAPEH